MCCKFDWIFRLKCQSGCISIASANVVNSIKFILSTVFGWIQTKSSTPFQRFPFGTKTPIGYLLAVALQYVMTTYHFLVLANVTSFGISCILFILSLAKDIRDNSVTINECVKNKSTNLVTFKKIVDFIQLHSAAKQLSSDTGKFTHCIQLIISIPLIQIDRWVVVPIPSVSNSPDFMGPCNVLQCHVNAANGSGSV